MTEAWEYKIIMVVPSGMGEEPLLKKCGEEGWEAVGIAADLPVLTVLMKRPKVWK